MPQRNRPFRRLCSTMLVMGLLITTIIPNTVIFTAALMHHDDANLLRLPFTLSHLIDLTHPLYRALILHAVWVGAEVALICLAISFPCALAIDQLPRRWQNSALVLLIIPFWTSTLVRTYAILNLLRAKGWLSTWLMQLGLIDQPLSIAFTPTATLIGLVYDLLPLMLVPLYLSVRALDHRQVEAAKDLGAPVWSRLRHVIWPHTAPSVLLGCLLVWLPAISLFYVPDILGGAKSLLLGNMIADSFTQGQWPIGAALCMSLMLPLMWLLPLSRLEKWMAQT